MNTTSKIVDKIVEYIKNNYLENGHPDNDALKQTLESTHYFIMSTISDLNQDDDATQVIDFFCAIGNHFNTLKELRVIKEETEKEEKRKIKNNVIKLYQ